MKSIRLSKFLFNNSSNQVSTCALVDVYSSKFFDRASEKFSVRTASVSSSVAIKWRKRSVFPRVMSSVAKCGSNNAVHTAVANDYSAVWTCIPIAKDSFRIWNNCNQCRVTALWALVTSTRLFSWKKGLGWCQTAPRLRSHSFLC